MRILSSLILIILLITLSGCSVRSGPVYLVTTNRTLDDASFNERARMGLENFEKNFNDWPTHYIQVRTEKRYIRSIQDALDSGARLIWSLDPSMGESVNEIARDNPNCFFAIVDWHPENEDDYLNNVVYTTFYEHEGSFLVGIIAGMVTESNTIGFVGGLKDESTRRYEAGFRAGVSYANPDAEVLVDYIHSTEDSVKAFESANLMINRDADIIYHAAGNAGRGVAEACEENDRLFIGNDRDQSVFARDHTLTSMIKRIETVIYAISLNMVYGSFPGGELFYFGITELGVDYAKNSSFNRELMQSVADAMSLKNRGMLVISDNPEDNDLFLIQEPEEPEPC